MRPMSGSRRRTDEQEPHAHDMCHAGTRMSGPRIIDRRRRRRLLIASAAAAPVIAGMAIASVTLTAGATSTPQTAPPSAAAAAQRDVELRAREQIELAVDVLHAQQLAVDAAGKATTDQLATLATAIATADAAADQDDRAEIAAASVSLAAAVTAVEQAVGAYSAQVRAVAAAEQEAAQRAAAEQAARDLAAQQKPPAGRPTATGTAAGDSIAVFTAHLAAVGATDFTVSPDWTVCGWPDGGPNKVQGCAQTATPTVVYMKPVDPALAATDVGRSVVIHEWAHLVQYRLGYDAVVAATDAIYGAGRGLEESADCMALQLGATGKPGGYTSDCSGARGTAAAALLAGRLP